MAELHEAKNHFWLAIRENGWCGEISFLGIYDHFHYHVTNLLYATEPLSAL